MLQGSVGRKAAEAYLHGSAETNMFEFIFGSRSIASSHEKKGVILLHVSFLSLVERRYFLALLACGYPSERKMPCLGTGERSSSRVRGRYGALPLVPACGRIYSSEDGTRKVSHLPQGERPVTSVGEA